MTTYSFNTAASSQQPYIFNLEREVAAFYRDHPEQKRQILFIDATTHPGGAICRGDETDEDEIAGLLGNNGYLYAAVKSTHKTGTGGSVRYNEEGYGCVILKMPRNQNDVSLLGYDTPSDIADVFSFDHETAHLLCPGGSEGDPRTKECIADAYAVIRHFQRFGADTGVIRNLTAMRTVEMILGHEDDHFTAPVVEKIIADSQTTDFSALTPAETIALATRYAADNAMDVQLVSYMAGNFNALDFKPIYLAHGNFSSLRKLGELVLKTTLPEEFKWGAVAVRAILDGNIGVDGIRLPKPVSPEWARLSQDLKIRAARFEQPQRGKLIVAPDMGL